MAEIFYWTGVLFWILVPIVALAIIYALWIHPAAMAVSLVRFLFRWHRAAGRPTWKLVREVPRAFSDYYREFLHEFGRSAYTMSDGSQWRGIGDWTLKPIAKEDKL